MDLIDFSKPTVMCDVILLVENKKLYCNRAILSIWSPVFETMFKSNFKEKESSEINLPGKNRHFEHLSDGWGAFLALCIFCLSKKDLFLLSDKSYEDIFEMLQIIYPPNKPISPLNVEKMLEFADEYQMCELNKRCRQFLMQQRGSIEILLIAQRYQFDDVIKRCAEHLKHTINSAVLASDSKIKEVNVETMNSLLIARIKHLETLMETFKKKVNGACEKFREIKQLPGI
jgi:hypothetical protein